MRSAILRNHLNGLLTRQRNVYRMMFYTYKFTVGGVGGVRVDPKEKRPRFFNSSLGVVPEAWLGEYLHFRFN